MTYLIICERKGADATLRTTETESIHVARDSFNHHVAMAVQHGEWCRVQIVPVATERNRFPRPIMAYDSNGVDVQVIDQDDDKYAWYDADTGTTWTRPTAHAYAMVCKALERKRQES